MKRSNLKISNSFFKDQGSLYDKQLCSLSNCEWKTLCNKSPPYSQNVSSSNDPIKFEIQFNLSSHSRQMISPNNDIWFLSTCKGYRISSSTFSNIANSITKIMVKTSVKHFLMKKHKTLRLTDAKTNSDRNSKFSRRKFYFSLLELNSFILNRMEWITRRAAVTTKNRPRPQSKLSSSWVDFDKFFIRKRQECCSGKIISVLSPNSGYISWKFFRPLIYRCLKWAFLIPLEMWKRPLEGFWLRIKEIFLWEYAVKFWGSALRSYPLCISWGKYRKFPKFIGRDSWWKGHWSMIFCKSFKSASLKPAIHSNTSRRNWFVVFVEVGIHCLKYYLRF